MSTKDLVNLTTVNKATRVSAIDEIKRRQEIFELNSKKSEKYINDIEYRTYINGTLRKYNKKLGLTIENNEELFDILWTIPEIEINLQSFTLHGLDDLTDISPIGNLTKLQSLTLDDLRNLSNIKPLENLVNLQSLELNILPKLTDITPLENLKKLKSLGLSGLKNLTDISPLENLKKLKSLKLIDLKNLTDISYLETVENRGVKISGNHYI